MTAQEDAAIEDFARLWLSDISHFSRLVVKRPLYAYQLEPAHAIVDSVLQKKALEFAVMFPRQSGKNETQSQVEAYLLNLCQYWSDAQMVKGQPSMRPQGQNALARLERSLDNDWNRAAYTVSDGRLVKLGKAMITFFSGNPDAKIVGATASLLLECDEAQDVLEAEWEKKFLPMAAFQNATIVYWGTAWTSRTLLAKTIRGLRELERADGIQRVFVVTADQVASENPLYGDFIKRQVAKKGRQHPLIKTQYFNEEIDAQAGMFPPARRALMRGTHAAQAQPDGAPAGTQVRPYALLLDVAGEDEGAVGNRTDTAALENPKRDATVLTVVEVDLSTLTDPLLAAPTYRVVHRQSWLGVYHATLYAQIRALAAAWRAAFLVADATGVGAGLVSFLAKALPAGVVIPFEFNSATKSRLGWDFMAVCDSGRFLEYSAELEPRDGERERERERERGSATFWTEVEFCQYEVMPGPAKLLRWGVPDGTRDPATAELVHDDHLLSAALVAVLDGQQWHVDTGPTHIIRQPDPLGDMDRGF